MHATKFIKTDESYETSDFDIDSKYIALQNNHRRLLGVTSALTEALEHAVRGIDFDLEDTLNECMKIYPELFGNVKKKIGHNSHRKIYNTSVSEDASDMASMHTINTQLNFHLKNLYGETKPGNIFQDKINHVRNPTILLESESEVSQLDSPNVVPTRFFPSNDDQKEKLLDENKNRRTETKSFLVLTPEYRPKSNSEENEKKISFRRKESLNENQEFFDETSYLVNHPDSDADFSHKNNNYYGHTNHENKFTNTELCEIEENIEIKTQSNDNYWPYEITVKKTVPQMLNRSDSNLLIQIKPETVESIKNLNKISNEKLKHSSDSETKSFATGPLETCIIITNHSENRINSSKKIENTPNNNSAKTKPKRMNNYENNIAKDLHINIDNFDSLLNDNLSPTSFLKNDTMDKLQKLSTGLKVQSNEMQIIPVVTEQTEPENNYMASDSQQQPWFGIPSQQSDKMGIIHRPESNLETIEIYYKKLKETLLTATINDRVTILQNLRLTLIHTLARERAELISSYVNNDILNINKEPLIESLLPTEIVNGWDLILQQMILKFLNTMCSIWKGRDYLASNIKTLSGLLNYFFKNSEAKPPTDSITLDMLMAIFNKLSTRQNQQTELVNSGVIEKILYNLMEGHSSMTTYRLKHSLGILINSCTYDNGRSLLEPIATEMLNMLKSLLNKNDKKITPYVSRLIYVLMANEVFHKKAKENDLLSTLEKTINLSNKRLKLQLDVLKSIIEKPNPHEFLYGTEEFFLSNIEAEMDELEEEVEIGDRPISNSRTEWHDKFKTKTNQHDERPIKTNHKNTLIPKKTNVTKFSREKPPVTKPKTIPSKLPINNKKPVKQEKPRIKPQFRKTMIPTAIADKPSDKKKQIMKRHEIVESPELNSKSYVILKDDKNNKIINSNVITGNERNELKNDEIPMDKSENENLSSAQDKNPKSDLKIDTETSFLVLDESESNKSPESNQFSTTESSNSADNMLLPSDIVKSDEMLDKLSYNQHLNDDGSIVINIDGNPTVSLFVQQGRLTEIEYEYCEDTKEIQSPVKYDNMFKNNRQSPYKGLLKENQKPIIFKTPEDIKESSETVDESSFSETKV